MNWKTRSGLVPREPGRRLRQNVALLALAMVLTAELRQLIALRRGHAAVPTGSRIALRLAHQFPIDSGVGSNSRESSSGVRSDLTNSTIRRRNSGGDGTLNFGIADTSFSSLGMPTEAGQLQLIGISSGEYVGGKISPTKPSA